MRRVVIAFFIFLYTPQFVLSQNNDVCPAAKEIFQMKRGDDYWDILVLYESDSSKRDFQKEYTWEWNLARMGLHIITGQNLLR